VNRIVENVLAIGRRERSVPETFALLPWLRAFATELTERMDLAPEQVTTSAHPADIVVVMDRSQLRQVLWNLCENGLRVSHGTPALELRAGLKPVSDTSFLDVIDHGPGIRPEVAEALFEPFVTGSPGGTGLGLYIAAELCECNQATLSLHANTPEGCCFRIGFPHLQRQQWSA
jgi:two-component system sensor histidine kinase PilS (NtrC family)